MENKRRVRKPSSHNKHDAMVIGLRKEVERLKVLCEATDELLELKDAQKNNLGDKISEQKKSLLEYESVIQKQGKENHKLKTRFNALSNKVKKRVGIHKAVGRVLDYCMYCFSDGIDTISKYSSDAHKLSNTELDLEISKYRKALINNTKLRSDIEDIILPIREADDDLMQDVDWESEGDETYSVEGFDDVDAAMRRGV